MEKTLAKYRMLLAPIGVLLLIAIISILGGSAWWTKYSEVNAQIAASSKNQKTLTEKIKILETSRSVVLESADATVIALPPKNSSLLAISQIKSLASRFSITLDNIDVTAGATTENISQGEIAFSAEGSYQSLIDFLKQIASLAPVMQVGKVKINQSGGTAIADISIATFWAAFPAQITGVAGALTDLTEDEKQTLDRINKLTSPTFSEVQPSTPSARSDPFSL